MNAVIRLLQSKWNSLNPLYQRYLLVGLLIVVLSVLIILLFALFHQDANLSKLMVQLEDKRTASMTEQIGSMRSQIDKLAASNQNTAEVTKINNELGEIEKNVTDVAKSNELQKIAAEMEAHLDALEKTVSANNPIKQYLDAKALPFQVVSVDVMSQQPFVSVDYEHHLIPLSIGDSLAGWKVVDADYSAVEVEFQNNQGQYVKIHVLEKISSAGGKE